MPEASDVSGHAASALGAKRRRAARACLSCRSRKVRCDVSRSGPPCMNCTLDGISCVVKARKPKSSARRNRQPSSHGEDGPDSPEHNDESVMETSPPQNHVSAIDTEIRTADSEPMAVLGNHAPAPEDHVSDPVSTRNTGFSMDDFVSLFPESKSPWQPAPAFMSENWLSASNRDSTADGLEIPPRHRHRALHMNSVVYTYYPFLTLDNLFSCLPQDVDFLEAEGCFHLPTRGIMDQIVRQYFLHIHPLLPLFNEGDFWEMYHNHRSPGEAPKMSLLVFQAIMFISCNFVNWSMESAKSFGYKSIRGLRAAFYRRAKLLYDFGAESSPVAISQAALLLSYWTPPVRVQIQMKPNTVWLSVAIQNAKNAEAPYYATLPPSPRSLSASKVAEAKRINMLKRLWWCCIIRDRILPLGLRRGIQITHAHFDFKKHRPLGLMDLDDEIHRSMVYSPEAKRELIRILSQVLDLCIILTDVLVLVFPLDGAFEQAQRRPAVLPSAETEIWQCKRAMVHWYTAALAASTGPGEGGAEINWTKHEYVILYTHVMYTYYHSARMALYNYELQHYLSLAADNSPVDTQRLIESRDAIQNAFLNITENLKGLNQRRLTRWLPISVAAYIAFPLALHVLNIHLSAADQHASNATLIEAMKVMHLQYDGVNWIARLVRCLIELVQDDPAFTNGRSVTDWGELLAVQPTTYLGLALALDLGMSSGRFPDKKDFIACLDGLRLRRSAKGLRSLTEPEQSSRVQEVVSEIHDPMTVADDTVSLPTAAPVFHNGRTVSVVGPGSRVTEDPKLHEEDDDDMEDAEDAEDAEDTEDAPFPDHVPCLGSPQQPGLSTEAGTDHFTCLPDDLEDFFGHTISELTASGDSFRQPQLEDYGADIDAALLVGQEAVPL